MKYPTIKKAGVVLALLLSTTSAHAYNQNSAKNACINKVTQYGSGQYYNASNVRVSDKGHHSYNVTGNVRSSRDNQSHHFTCNVRHKEVVNWKVNSSKSHNNNTAAAIGVGVLAIALAAAVHNKHKKKKKHQKNNQHQEKSHQNDRYNDYDSGGNPFSDMRYLKRQCRQNIRHHLKRDHGQVRKIGFDSAHLDRRELRGTGYVIFERGGERELSYNCEFDRRGNIYDGYYRYRYRR